MAEDNRAVRTAPSSMDWDGSTLACWSLTDASCTDPVHVHILKPALCVPLYPLRYGLSQAGCTLAPVSATSCGDYPEPPTGKEWGLRLLRPQSIVYLMYHGAADAAESEAGFQALPFQVTADARFAPLVEGESDSPDDANAIPYLPAPPTDVADTVYLLVTDTRLTQATLDELAGRLDALAGTIVTRVKPAEPADGQQDVARVKGTLDSHIAVPEMASARYETRGLDMRWSESLHDAPPGSQAVSTLQRLFLRLNPGKGLAGKGLADKGPAEPLAAVLHDPVGALSELSNLLGGHLDDRGAYASEAARKLRVRDMIRELGDQKYAQAEGEARARANTRDPRVFYHTPPDEYAEQQASKARDARLASYRKTEADAFHAAHEQKMEDYQREISQAAEALWRAWQGLQERYLQVMELHSDEDDQNFLDLRVVVANTVLGLVESTPGQQWLAAQLGDDGPAEGTLLHRVLMGHAALKHYIEQESLAAEQRFPEDDTYDLSESHSADIRLPGNLQRSTALKMLSAPTAAALARLQKTLETLPADGASQRIGLVTAALVFSGKLKTPASFLLSPYRAALEASEGSLLQQGSVPTGSIGSWMLREHNGTIARGFRNTTVMRAGDEVVTAYTAYQLHLSDLGSKLRFWHNVRRGWGWRASSPPASR